MGMRKLRLNPYQQGQLDALCGPYAIVNALRIVFPGMSKAECSYLLARCIEELEAQPRHRGSYECGVNLWGMSRLIKNVVVPGYPVAVKRPFRNESNLTSLQLWKYLLEYFEAPGTRRAAIMRGIIGGEDHWTVVYAATPSRLGLFDSCNRRILHKHRFMENEKAAGKGDLLFPAQVFIISRSN